MALTSVAYLQSRTAFPDTGFLAPALVQDSAAGWSSDDRKAIHEDYWGQTVLDYVTADLVQERDFQQAWALIQYREYLTGSVKGQKFVRRQGHWARKLLGRPRHHQMDDLAAIPFLPFLFRGRVELISLRGMVLLRQQILRQLIAPLVGSDTALFDLGSGWGRHALMFADQFPSLAVHAGELSQAGQRATDSLSARYGLQVTSFGFNYLDWNDLVMRVEACPQSKIIIFSSHSIEQVTYVDHAMWASLARLGKSIEFVHIEPVGWQIETNATTPFSRPPRRDGGVQAGYNKNLVAVTDAVFAEGLITEPQVAADYLAFGNPTNSGTLLRFSATR